MGSGVPSQVMVDKAQSIPREKIGETFGRLGDAERLAIDRALALFLGLV
jgi:mRNA interferase MazF